MLTILSSALLAKERGPYQTFKGSKWDRGIFPQDTIALLEEERGLEIDGGARAGPQVHDIVGRIPVAVQINARGVAEHPSCLRA